ncbi:hypothetical protein ABT324_13940 [Saccharopolyspora sp. NPDC000359]|uniref:hypothetical protein n=1 Tax=Saccharopolyspora sp. NPDC000359 TaxID=3154251 RepID=UPI003323580C
MDPPPTFALDDTHWAAAFPEGVVLADHHTGGLDDLVAFSIDHRYAWPFRWGEVLVVPDVAAAHPHLAPNTQKILKPLLGRSPVAADGTAPDVQGVDARVNEVRDCHGAGGMTGSRA